MKEYTVSTFADELGVSWNSVYKAGKELFPNKQWGKNAVLNGTTEILLNHYTNSSKSTTAKKAKKLLLMVSDSTGIKEPESMKSTVEIKKDSRGIQEEMKSEIKKESIVEAPKESMVEISESGVNKSWIQRVFEFDLGRAILESPLIRFVFVSAMVGGQAYMFASMEQKVINGLNFIVPFWAAMLTGILFEAAGFMIAMSTDPKKEMQGIPTRNIWLFIMLFIQFSTNFCLIEPWAVDGWHCFGRFILSIAIPLGLLAYSFLYFKE